MLDTHVEYIIGLVFDAIYLDKGVGDLAHVFHVSELRYGNLYLLASLVDQVGEFVHPGFVGINAVEVYLLGGCVNVVGDIIQRSGQRVDILSIEWGDEIPLQLGENIMCELIVGVLHILDHLDQSRTLIEIRFGYDFFKLLTHLVHI
jgi:hypothetical protein